MSVGYRITAILSRKFAHRVTKETSIPLFWMAHGEPMRSPVQNTLSILICSFNVLPTFNKRGKGER